MKNVSPVLVDDRGNTATQGAENWLQATVYVVPKQNYEDGHRTPAKRPHLWGERLTVVPLAIWLAGCHQPPATHGLPAPEVTVSKPEQKEVVNWNEFTGRTAAVKLVNVTPRVSGYIVDIPFQEGDIVHKGDLLFQIDPRPYQHACEQAVGQLQQAQANKQLQDVTFARQQRLRETGVIAKEDYDTALSNKDQAAAQVIAAQAALNSAELNLEFSHVTSPISGRVSRQLVNIGNLVKADSTQLTTIVSIDPIYAYFSMDELAALRYQRLVGEGKLARSQDGKTPVYLQLQDETGFPHEGTIDFSDNSFDSSTGTLLVWGTGWHHAVDGNIQVRHRPKQRSGTGSESGCDRRAAIAAGG